MDQHEWLAKQFEENRAHLQAVAHRMLGSPSEADDAVQESWLRVSRSDTSEVENLGGWLTTVVARVCLDMLRSRKSRPEEPLEARPSEPVLGQEDGSYPEHEALVAESVGPALLVVLDALAPAERVAFVLHDVFGVPFDEIAPIVSRSPAAARQLASRARRRVQGSSSPDASAPREVVRAFLAAAQGGDFQALLTLLDPSVVFRSDSAAVGIGAPASLAGPEAVARRFSGAKALRVALIDGTPGLVWAQRRQPKVVFTFTLRDSKVAAIDLIAAPERLEGLKIEYI